MQCPKCGGEIPFYDLKPNCKHCGVNIRYYTQETNLTRDAKRTELEGASARMVIARVKAQFIGGGLAIARLALTLLAAAALLLPFGSVRYAAPFMERTFSAGIIGLIKGFEDGGDGLIMNLPSFLGSTVYSAATKAMLVPVIFFLIAALMDIMIALALIIGFVKLTKSAKFMQNAALAGAITALIGQILTLIVFSTSIQSDAARLSAGFGALAAAATFIALFFLNRAMLKKGIEPVYKENDIKRKALLVRLRAGEIHLDDLPLPVFESDEEHEARMKALEEALLAEEESKEL